ncbi:MAG: hypothetical protein M1812_005485 [Candelaria pacifica]|nr:MAG: hypothetical protein M1812_005485 [Candelaria pacifica]
MKHAVGLCLALFALMVSAQHDAADGPSTEDNDAPKAPQCAAACGLWILMNKTSCQHGNEPATCLCKTDFRKDLDKCLARKPVGCMQYGVTDEQVYKALEHTCAQFILPHDNYYGAASIPFPKPKPPFGRI